MGKLILQFSYPLIIRYFIEKNFARHFQIFVPKTPHLSNSIFMILKKNFSFYFKRDKKTSPKSKISLEEKENFLLWLKVNIVLSDGINCQQKRTLYLFYVSSKQKLGGKITRKGLQLYFITIVSILWSENFAVSFKSVRK